MKSYRSGLFNMINAAITPGIHPHIVRIKTINTEPQPLSITASGGNKIESRTLQKLIRLNLQINIQLYLSVSVRFVTMLINSISLPIFTKNLSMRSVLILFSFLITILTACKDNQPSGDEVEQTPIIDTTDKLLGKISKDNLMKPAFSEWFQPTYKDYIVNTDLIDSYKDQLKDYEIDVFMGTWCEDSQREVPALLKILEAADYPMEQLRMVAIDDEIANYKRSPDGDEEGRNIHHVPTIILKMDNKEVNRIIEYPVRTMEEDLQVILEGNYTPFYYVADIIHERLNQIGLEEFKNKLEALVAEFNGKPRDVYELNTYAKTIFRQGRKEEGILVATLNTMIYPENPNAYAGLGSRLTEMDRNEESVKILEKAVELAPDDSEFKGLLEEVKAKL